MSTARARRWDPSIDPPPACPDQVGDRPHQVRELGSFGLELGNGFECHTCWAKFTVTPDGTVAGGHPPPAPYPAWDFDEEG